VILDDPATIERYRSSGWWQDTIIDAMFRQCVDTMPAQLALVDAPDRAAFAPGAARQLSFAETDTAVDQLAATLLQAGVRKDDIVVVQLPNIVEIVIAFLACARIGAIASPVMLAYGERDLRRIVTHLAPRCVLTLEAFKTTRPGAILRALCAELDERDATSTTVLTLTEWPDGEVGFGATGTAADMGALRRHLDTLTVDANEIVTLHWTSGTTGHPKCVPHSHNQWRATGGCCVDAGGLQHGDRILAPMQMVHTAGYNGMFMPWLETQGTLVLHQPFDMAIFMEQIATWRINHTVTAPAMLNALLRGDSLAHHDVSSIRSILCGSAPLDGWMIAAFRSRYDIEIVNAFGSTEGLTLLANERTAADPQRRARYFPRFRGTDRRAADGTSWGVRLAAAVETRLLDLDTGEEIAVPHVAGEFAFRSPALFPGYLQADGTLDRKDFDGDGYFRTGEIFEIAGAGAELDYYHYIDRLKDVINRGGVKIPAGELEAAIQALPHVIEAAAIGYPDARLGEQICAVLVLASGQSLTLDALNTALKDAGIARFMLPERIEIIAALPRSATGKVLKRELVRQLTTPD